jgi:replicative DNA helicase
MNIADLELDVLVNCYKSDGAIDKAIESLNGYVFSEKPYHWLWKYFRQAYRAHRKIPSLKVFALKAENEIKNNILFEEVFCLLKEIKKAEPKDKIDVLLPELSNAYNKQLIIRTTDELLDTAATGNINEAKKILADGLSKVNNIHHGEGSTGLVESARAILLDNEKEKEFVPTGLSWIDRQIIGIEKGELFVMAGITGVGKSAYVVQAGHSCVGNNKRVLHIVTEMTKAQVVLRYMSLFTGILLGKLRNNELSIEDKEVLNGWLNRNEKRLDNLFQVKQISGSMIDVVDEVRIVEEKLQNKLDLIIIDSPDHLGSERKYSNRREESTETWWAVKKLALEGYAVWATTQIAKKYDMVLATPEHVAENYNISRIADSFMSINYEYKGGIKTDRRLLYWGKYRSGEAQKVIPLDCQLERMYMSVASNHRDEE